MISAKKRPPCSIYRLAIAVIFDQAQQWVRERAPTGGLHLFRGLNQVSGRNPGNDANQRAGALCYDAYVATRDVDIVHLASPFEGFTDDTAVGWGELSGVATAATMYDLIPFQQPEVHLDNLVREVWFERRLRELARADVLSGDFRGDPPRRARDARSLAGPCGQYRRRL